VTDFYADVSTWVVLIDQVQLIAVEVGQQFTSNHDLRIFIDEAEAIEFAISIGWQPEPEPELEP
jgi:hypothetical protein